MLAKGVRVPTSVGPYRVDEDPTEVGTLNTVGESGTIRLDSRSVNAAGLNAKDT